jgi:hypothetical protein
MDIYAEASATALALVRSAALGHRRGTDDRDPGQLVRDYAEKVCLAQGLDDATEPLALLVGALAQLGGVAVLGLHVQVTGHGYDEIDPDQLREKLDDLELIFMSGGGLKPDAR